VEADGAVVVTVSVSREVYGALVEYCRWRGVGVSELVEALLREFLAREGLLAELAPGLSPEFGVQREALDKLMSPTCRQLVERLERSISALEAFVKDRERAYIEECEKDFRDRPERIDSCLHRWFKLLKHFYVDKLDAELGSDLARLKYECGDIDSYNALRARLDSVKAYVDGLIERYKPRP
jgi:Ribbon-helix-helix protein, copG family.